MKPFSELPKAGWVRWIGDKAGNPAWFAATAFALAASALVAFLTFRHASSDLDALANGQRRITSAVFGVYAAALDVETGERGFLLTQQTPYLEPFNRGAAQMESAFAELKGAFGDNGDAQAAVETVHGLAQKRLSLSRHALALTPSGGVPDAARMALEDEGKATMDQVRAGLAQIQDHQLGWSTDLKAAAERSLWGAQATFFFCFSVAAVLLTAAFLIIPERTSRLVRIHEALLVEVTERQRLDAAVRASHQQLEQRVAERTHELAAKTATLERSNADLEQFASVASHDLQEPLRAMAGCAQLLERKYRGTLDESADGLIRMIVEGSSRMKGMVDGLLAYSRSGQGDGVELVDAGVVLKGALANLSGAVAESQARITVGNLPCVPFHPAQFEQIFQNLLGNALKYRSALPPAIHVEAERQANGWRFSIADNGIGFEPEFAEKVFRVFRRLHSRERYPGDGLGLAIVRRLVERRGGKAWAESTPGHGATFFFTVPDGDAA